MESVLNGGGKATVIDLDHNGAAALIGNLVKLGASIKKLEDPTYFRLSEPEIGWSFEKSSRTN